MLGHILLNSASAGTTHTPPGLELLSFTTNVFAQLFMWKLVPSPPKVRPRRSQALTQELIFHSILCASSHMLVNTMLMQPIRNTQTNNKSLPVSKKNMKGILCESE